MRSTNTSLRTVALIALAAAILAAGCGRRQSLDELRSAPAPDGAVTTRILASGAPTSLEASSGEPSPGLSPEPVTGPTTTPAGAALPSPDLASIEAQLSGIDADLGADLLADSNEGNPQ